MKLDNMRLRTKSLIPLGVMYFAMLFIAGFAAYRLHDVSDQANDIISNKDKAAMYIARASREAMMAPYSAFGALTFEGSSPEGRTAQADFALQVDHLKTSLDVGVQSAPDYSNTFDSMRTALKDIETEGKSVLAIADGWPGLAAGRALTPEMLDKLAEGARVVTDMDSKARDIATGLLNINDEMINDSVKSGRDLKQRSQFDLELLAAATAGSALIAGALMFWVFQIKIARPLTVLAARARALADGDLDTAIAGATRKDEIGDIARAIRELTAHARERGRLEAEAEATRRSAEAERERTHNDRARAQAELSQVVQRLGQGLHAVAAGDLTLRLQENFPPEYRSLRADFNEASEKLEGVIGEVAEAAREIRSGAHEVTAAAAEISTRSERQADRLEQAAAALDGISAAMKQAVANGAEASGIVAEADRDARQGAVVVKQAVEAMGAIARSAEQIREIIGVIDELALQTNLLALNAGVEAARAGEAGRGFAVVAAEVRALALRSTDSARRIKELVHESSVEVGKGVQLADESGRSLERIVAQVSRINVLVADMASVIRDQAAGVETVNGAVGDMDKATQESRASFETAAASTRSLAAESERLADLVAQFQIGELDAGDERYDVAA